MKHLLFLAVLLSTIAPIGGAWSNVAARQPAVYLGDDEAADRERRPQHRGAGGRIQRNFTVLHADDPGAERNLDKLVRLLHEAAVKIDPFELPPPAGRSRPRGQGLQFAGGTETHTNADGCGELPIAEAMYLSAYAEIVVRNWSKAVKPFSHLAEADPIFADVQNALAIALLVTNPANHASAFQHAEKAVALAPDVPQFVVTYVLTDRSQWKIEVDGTVRLTRAAALALIEARVRLLNMSDQATRLETLLRSIRETGSDTNFPFVFADYAKLMKKPHLALTRPESGRFCAADRAIYERISALRQKLEDAREDGDE